MIDALVWRESVYKNNFYCQCGNKLYDIEKSYDENSENIKKKNNHLYCPKCDRNVAYITKVPKDRITSKLMGNINEFKDSLKESN